MLTSPLCTLYTTYYWLHHSVYCIIPYKLLSTPFCALYCTLHTSNHITLYIVLYVARSWLIHSVCYTACYIMLDHSTLYAVLNSTYSSWLYLHCAVHYILPTTPFYILFCRLHTAAYCAIPYILWTVPLCTMCCTLHTSDLSVLYTGLYCTLHNCDHISCILCKLRGTYEWFVLGPPVS